MSTLFVILKQHGWRITEIHQNLLNVLVTLALLLPTDLVQIPVIALLYIFYYIYIFFCSFLQWPFYSAMLLDICAAPPYEHCGNKIPKDKHHSFRVQQLLIFILYKPFQRCLPVIGWCRAQWEVLRTEIGQIDEPFQVTLSYSSCLEEKGATVALDALEFIDCELGKVKVPKFFW